MQRAAALLSATALLFAVADLAAQQRPSFTGTWTVAAAEGGAPGGGMGGGRAGGGGGGGGGGGRAGGGMGGGGMAMLTGLGQQATISQDGSTLTIVRTTPQGEVRSVYNLDGSPRTNAVAVAGMSVEPVSRARWDGSRLAITTAIDFAGNQIETTMTLSMDESGALVVESGGMGGMGGRGGGGPTTTRYTKQ